MHPARSALLRRWFFVSLALAATVIVLVRFLVFPEARDSAEWELTVGAVLDNLLAAVITSLALGLTYVLLLPKPEAEQIEVIPSAAISPAIEAAARECAHWSVRARFAAPRPRPWPGSARSSPRSDSPDWTMRMSKASPTT